MVNLERKLGRPAPWERLFFDQYSFLAKLKIGFCISHSIGAGKPSFQGFFILIKECTGCIPNAKVLLKLFHLQLLTLVCNIIFGFQGHVL